MNFSVVTPSLNQLDWLKLAAASVASQISPQLSIEHIVQDGGSGEELLFWGSSQPGIRFQSEADSGMYDAINKGLKKSTGDICSYLNCDEQYLPGTLERVREYFLQNPDIDLVAGDVIVTDKNGVALSYRRPVPPIGLDRWHILSTLSAAVFFRKRVLDEGFYFPDDYRIIGDAVWVDRLLRARKRFGIIPMPLSIFCMTGKNLSKHPIAANELDRWRRESGSEAFGWLRTIVAKAAFRLRKFGAGAYWPRSISYEMFLYSPGPDGRPVPTRTRISASRLSGRWVEVNE